MRARIAALLLFAVGATAVTAFNPSAVVRRGAQLTSLHCTADDDAHPSGTSVVCRRSALCQTLGISTTAAAVVAGGLSLYPTQASAGVGAPVLFDESVKVYFAGALTNAVAALRIESALRWKNISDNRRVRNFDNKKKAKYGPRNTLVASCGCKDDTTPVGDTVAGMLAKDLSNAGVAGVVSLDCGSGGIPSGNIMSDLAAEAKKLSETAGGRNVNIVLVYGPHVGVSKDGRVGYVERRVADKEDVAVSEYVKAVKEGSSPDEEAKAISAAAKQAYKTIRDKIERQIDVATGGTFWGGISELSVIGGLTINRSKFGKEGGEDCFYALSARTITSDGESFDFYDGAFGDRDISPKDRE